MIAVDAEYHLSCLCKLYRDARVIHVASGSGEAVTEKAAKEIAFLELVDYIEDYRGTGEVLTMGEVVEIHKKRLQNLGILSDVHTSRLRERLLVCSRPQRNTISRSRMGPCF